MAYEDAAYLILCGAWGFTDDDEIRGWGSLTEYDLRSVLDEAGAPSTGVPVYSHVFVVECLQRTSHVAPWGVAAQAG